MHLLSEYSVTTAYENTVRCMDALALLRALPDSSVDLIATDFPYGVHEAGWDKSLDLAAFWTEAKRVLKPRCTVLSTAQQPFTTDLINSNRAWFKYSWVWIKSLPGDFFNAKNKPMRLHEDIPVFSNGTTANRSPNLMRYYPQDLQPRKTTEIRNHSQKYRQSKDAIIKTRENWKSVYEREYTNYPNSVLYFPHGNNTTEHINQKPVALYEYLIRTYTQPGDLVVDPFAGSGTTGVAARNLNRRYILGDTSPEYVEIARKRLALPYTVNMFEMAAGD